MENSTILFENKWFTVIEKQEDGCVMSGLRPKLRGVVVLPYTKKDGKFDKLGVRNEMNLLWSASLTTTAITGGIEHGEAPLTAAIRELKEEGGFDVDDPKKWDFLGKLRTSKLIDGSMFCYAVNVSDIEQKEPEGDGTPNEAKSTFKMITPSELSKTDDGLLLSLIMKYFMYNYGD